MATKMSTKTKSQLRALDQKFPGHSGDKPLKIVQSQRCDAPEAEIASLRNELMNEDADFSVNPNSFRWMQPCNRRRIAAGIEVANQGRFHWRTNLVERQEYEERIRRASPYIRLNQDAAEELAAYRAFEITSDIVSLPFALGAFQSINLADDEIPLMLLPQANQQHFAVRYIGRDGGARQDQWRHARSAETMELHMVATDKVEYTLMDLHEGNINQLQAINTQLRFDMEQKIEDLALESLEANVRTDGIKALMNIHPSVDQANIPDGNYLDLTDVPTYGAANIFTITRLKAILDHLAKWGFNFAPDGAISISQMIMSPQNARDSWDYVDLVSGWNTEAEAWGGRHVDDPHLTVPTGVREQIFSSGSMLQSAWGYSWQTTYNPRVSKGRLYVMTNLPVGWYFTKSSFDRVLEWKDTPDHIEQNYGQIMMMKPLTFVQPTLWAYRYLVVDF